MRIKLFTVILLLCLGLSNSQPTAVAKQHSVSSNNRVVFSAQQLQIDHTLRILRSTVHKTPYVYSGDTRRGWDCSGLVSWFYSRLGREIPHSATKQAHIGQRVSSPIPGDIVVFAYTGRTDFYHSAIYLGDGKIINANYYYGTTVIEPLKDYQHSQIRYIRLNTKG